MHALALVGASVRAAAMSVRRAGMAPVTADLFADADLRALCPASRITAYPNGFAEWLTSANADAWLYTGGLENHPRLVDTMARDKTLLGNPGYVLRQVRAPGKVAQVLSQHGIRFPELRHTPSGLPRDGSWLVKTGRGCSGLGISRFKGSVPNRLLKAGSLSGESPFYQKWIAGIPGSAIYIAAAGQSVLLGVTYQLIGYAWSAPRPFQYAGSIGPWPLDHSVLDALRNIGDVLCCEFNLVGLFGVDFILSSSGNDRVSGYGIQGGSEGLGTNNLGNRPDRAAGTKTCAADITRTWNSAAGEVWVIEINPRYTASVEVIERMIDPDPADHGPSAADWDFKRRVPTQVLAMHAAACQGKTIRLTTHPATKSPPLYHGKVILFARHDIRIPRSFTAWALDVNNNPAIEVRPADENGMPATVHESGTCRTPNLTPTYADIPLPHTIITRGQPIATCFASGTTPCEVADQLQQRLRAMERRTITQ